MRSRSLAAPALAALAFCLPAAALPGGPSRSHRLDGSTARKLPVRALANASTPGDNFLPHLTYYGGHVLPNVRVVSVYWNYGSYFTSADGVAFRSKADAFYAAVVHGPQFEWLSEYSTNLAAPDGSPGTNQVIGGGSFRGSVLLTPSITGTSFGEQSIISELGKQLDSHALPANDGDTLYMVHFPPEITIVDGADQSCVSYCAFHDSFGKDAANVYFAVMPDHSPGGACNLGCGESADWFSNLSSSASHELVETVTDPEVGTIVASSVCAPSWCDPASRDDLSIHGEIGDICEGNLVGDTTQAPFTDTGGATWVMQREWSNQASACITTRAQAFSVTLSPPTLVAHTAGTYDFTVATTAPASGAATAALSLRPLPTGVTGSFDAPSLATGGSTKLHLTLGGDVGAFTFGVFADSGPTLAMAAAVVQTDDFSASTTTPSISLKAGGSAQLTIATSGGAVAGSQDINIQLTGKPAGLSMTASPSTVHPGLSSVVTVTAAAGTPTIASGGSLIFTLANGLRIKTLVVPVTIDGDDFTAAADAGSPFSFAIGGSSTFHITTAASHGRAQTLSFAGKQLPPGVTARFSPATVLAGGTTTATLQATHGASTGPVQLFFTVSGPVASQDLQITAAIQSSGCSTAGAPVGWIAALALLALRKRAACPRGRPVKQG